MLGASPNNGKIHHRCLVTYWTSKSALLFQEVRSSLAAWVHTIFGSPSTSCEADWTRMADDNPFADPEGINPFAVSWLDTHALRIIRLVTIQSLAVSCVYYLDSISSINREKCAVEVTALVIQKGVGTKQRWCALFGYLVLLLLSSTIVVMYLLTYV